MKIQQLLSGVIVMSAAGNDKHNAVFFEVNDAVHIVDAAAPPAAERTAQRFRLAAASTM